MQSMTAYGRATAEAGRPVTVEVKSVNNRFLDLSVRLPRNVSFLEEAIKAEVSAFGITRGKTDITVTLGDDPTASSLSVDEEFTASYVTALRALQKTYKLRDDISVMEVARRAEVFRFEKPEEDEEKVKAAVLPVVRQALEAFVTARRKEGERLAKDLRAKVDEARSLVRKIGKLSEEDTKNYRSRLEARLRTVLGEQGVTVNDNRILTECAIFADKIAVDEETVRLFSHFDGFLNAMDAAEACGRKLDFFTQEMNREINTVGSKCQNAEIAAVVVDVKCLFEKIREQVQNIE